MNTLGRIFRITIHGESHGPAIGVVIDGCPAGIPLDPADFEEDLARRRSGAEGTTPRREQDQPRLLSGVWQGRTTGAPLHVLFENRDTRSADYGNFTAIPRPGHADFTAMMKYGGWSDPRGSGHFSGRITAGIVAAGVVAKKVLQHSLLRAARLTADNGQVQGSSAVEHAEPDLASAPAPTGIRFQTSLLAVGGSKDINLAIQNALKDGDSVGGLVEIRIRGIPAGFGEPMFYGAESAIAHALFAVPGVRGVEFGDGFAAAAMRGSEHNDPFIDAQGHTSRNGAGGINGGITNGNEIIVRAAVKPASSIARSQHTWNFAEHRMTELQIPGRHDTCIALRAAVVLEAATACALADLALLWLAAMPLEQNIPWRHP